METTCEYVFTSGLLVMYMNMLVHTGRCMYMNMLVHTGRCMYMNMLIT